MNDDLNLTDEQLQLATARSLPSKTTLDSETLAARETFLALGAAANAAAGDFDEAKLIARLHQSCLNDVTSSEKAIVHRPAMLQRWPLLLGGVLAASILVALTWFAVTSQSNSSGQIASNPSTPLRTSKQLPMLKAVAWTDPLDDEIALAEATLDQLSARNRGFDGSLLQINERLEALSQELSVESL
jgi:hypothetical protein